MASRSLLALLCVVASIAVVSAYPAYALKDLADGQWAPPGPGDVRGPCPALNTLANHGYLPRNGMNITRSNLTSALESVYSLSTVLANTLAVSAITEDGSDGEISLNQLDTHNTIEHDASMSRLDFYFGDNHDLNQGLFQSLMNCSSDGVVITEDDIAAYQSQRQQNSQSTNPTFTFGLAQQTFASGEAALLLAIMGESDGSSYNVSLATVKVFFGSEQLPEGWNPPSTVGTIEITSLANTIKSKWT